MTKRTERCAEISQKEINLINKFILNPINTVYHVNRRTERYYIENDGRSLIY